MTIDAVRDAIDEILLDVVPNARLEVLDRSRPFRAQLDMDSMDVLTIVEQIHARLHVNIPERDYDRVASLDDLAAYVASRVPSTA